MLKITEVKQLWLQLQLESVMMRKHSDQRIVCN